MEPISHLIDRSATSEAKIALFRSLFRGRDDVYPRRFESRKTGKAGYAPACANEWVRGICEKPRIKCGECQHRRFFALTDDVVRWHLSGQDADGQPFVAGVYPMLLDETCFFLAVDFDKAGWREDATAFLETCRRLSLPAALERSRSGRGGHVWLFFENAIPAILARKLGSYILTETMEGHPEAGLDSYDRLFPNQDTLPRGGFGNLIALPLQKQPRERGNSVFVDEQLAPYSDQWTFLSGLQKITRLQLETIVRDAEHRGRVIGVRTPPDEEEDSPWTLPAGRHRKEPAIVGELPHSLEVVLGNEIYIAKAGLVPALRNRLLRLAAFQNPEFFKAQAMRLPTYGKPRVIGCAEDHPQHLGLPRGCLDDVCGLLSNLKIRPAIRDERYAGKPLAVTFQGQLRPEQELAAKAMLAHDTGVLSATTAFGKTVIAAWLIAKRGVNTLVLVHRQQLLDQWVERLSAFLNLPVSAIGRIGGGRKRPNGLLDVALMQSLVRKGVVQDLVGEYGQLVVDECHHLSAQSFEQVARRAKARFVAGLSATVARKDGHHPIIFMQCGPVRHRVSAKAQAASRPFEHTVIVCPTAFQSQKSEGPDARLEFHALYQELVENETRNQRICDDIVRAVTKGRTPLVLTERNQHLDLLASGLFGRVPHLVVLRGGMSRKERDAAGDQLAAIRPDEGRVILATGRYVGEGFDDARLDTLFVTLPVSWRGTIAQYVGRLHRLYDGKAEVHVYDYADVNVPMLARMFDRRCSGYEAVGYTIMLPASALPGWPADVTLPADPLWKRDYAGSVRRLVRDGVDAALGNLFVHAAGVQATHTIAPEIQGASRARSATEAFLYARLETLPETKGRFQVNVHVPIAFDSFGSMEVDFLCADSRLVVEVDGPQHLDPAAYRRDRRKDQLLQENGYLILRFLAEDVARDLDAVLDGILRSLSHRPTLRRERFVIPNVSEGSGGRVGAKHVPIDRFVSALIQRHSPTIHL
jgi:superfamily II DNA or RNA helicase/very-short-patch-repair endonuclease